VAVERGPDVRYCRDCVARHRWFFDRILTANGIPLNDNVLTAAHKSLPFGSKVKVTNKKSGHAVTVTIMDRGAYVKGRCIDLSKAGARALGFTGLAPVSVVPVVSD
jgi:rare lipoprotein A